jgi:hypothetical protein
MVFGYALGQAAISPQCRTPKIAMGYLKECQDAYNIVYDIK